MVRQSEGHLSSRSVSNSGHGSEQCPWVIVVQPGKTVDVYVIDFSLTSRYHDLMSSNDDDEVKLPVTHDDDDDDDYCHVYATVRELPSLAQAEGQSQGYVVHEMQTRGQGRVQVRVESQGHDEVKICAGNRREQRVYSSVSNALSVQLSPLVFDDPTANFLLKYVGNFVRFSFRFILTRKLSGT